MAIRQKLEEIGNNVLLAATMVTIFIILCFLEVFMFALFITSFEWRAGNEGFIEKYRKYKHPGNKLRKK